MPLSVSHLIYAYLPLTSVASFLRTPFFNKEEKGPYELSLKQTTSSLHLENSFSKEHKARLPALCCERAHTTIRKKKQKIENVSPSQTQPWYSSQSPEEVSPMRNKHPFSSWQPNAFFHCASLSHTQFLSVIPFNEKKYEQWSKEKGIKFFPLVMSTYGHLPNEDLNFNGRLTATAEQVS